MLAMVGQTVHADGPLEQLAAVVDGYTPGSPPPARRSSA
jgi:hypothetical protein